MITKLRWLKSLFDRAILPASGSTIGKILYTAKNTTGRRKQYVIDLDASTYDITTIDASPADPLTSPGAIVTQSGLIAPGTDKSLYVFGGAILPVLLKVIQGAFTQSIANGGSIAAINILTGVTIDGVAATNVNCTLVSVSATNLLLNTTTGAVTVVSNTTAGVATLSYRIESKNEPGVFVTGTVNVTIAA